MTDRMIHQGGVNQGEPLTGDVFVHVVTGEAEDHAPFDVEAGGLPYGEAHNLSQAKQLAKEAMRTVGGTAAWLVVEMSDYFPLELT